MASAGTSQDGFTSTVFDPGVGEEQPAVDVDALVRGESLDRYFLIERVGAGGMGVVWSAYDPELDRKVALKLLRPRRTGGAQARARLIREAQAMARLSHPNVTALHAVGDYGGHIYLAMDLVEGKTLGRWVRATQRGWEEIVAMFVQAGRGLAEAHRVGIVHRDFKPDNVLIGGERARVTDFGLARGLEPAADQGASEAQPRACEAGPEPHSKVREEAALTRPLTRTGAMIGTPAYMAPEQFSSSRFDARSDQFSFCVALWEALYGQRPFGGTTLEALSCAVRAGHISKPEHELRGVPATLEAALRRGLSVEPEQRWPSMDALLAELERRPSSSWRRAAMAAAALLGSFGLAYVATPLFAAGQREEEVGELCPYASASAELSGEARAQELERGLVRGELEPALVAQLRGEFRAYALRWEAQQRSLCNESNAPTLARRARCLERRRVAFELRTELVQGKGGREGEGGAMAVSLLAGLPALEDCERPAYLAQLREVEDSPDLRSLWRELEQARALRELGQAEQAVARLEQVQAATRSGELAALRAQVLVEGAGALAQVGREGEARAQLEQGFALALREGDARACAEAALIFASLERGADALVWVGRGRACYARLGVPTLEQSELSLAEARALAALGEDARLREHLVGLLSGLGVGEDLAKLGDLRPAQAFAALGVVQQLAELSMRAHAQTQAQAQLWAAHELARRHVGLGHPRSTGVGLALLDLQRRRGAWAEAGDVAARLEQRGDPALVARVRLTRAQILLARAELAPPEVRRRLLARLDQRLAQIVLTQGEPRARARQLIVQAGALRAAGELEAAQLSLSRAEGLLGRGADGRAHADTLALELGLERARMSLGAGRRAQARSECALVVEAGMELGPPAALALAEASLARALAGAELLARPEQIVELEQALARWDRLSSGGQDHVQSLPGLEALAALDLARAPALRARADAIRARLLAVDVAL